MAQKPDDWHAVFACSDCHDAIDKRSRVGFVLIPYLYVVEALQNLVRDGPSLRAHLRKEAPGRVREDRRAQPNLSEPAMTPEQTEQARHALGLPNRARKSYRNHFVTGEGSSDHPIWMAMFERGDARRWPGNQLTGGDDLFRLTKQGATAALKPREKLSTEDFPA